MLAKIVGIFLIVIGVFFFLFPEGMRKRLRKKALRHLRWYLFATVIFVGSMLISAGWKYPGTLPKIIVIIGIIALIKALFLLKTKAAEHATQWILKQPAWMLRLFCLIDIALGLVIYLGLRE